MLEGRGQGKSPLYDRAGADEGGGIERKNKGGEEIEVKGEAQNASVVGDGRGTTGSNAKRKLTKLRQSKDPWTRRGGMKRSESLREQPLKCRAQRTQR